MTGKLEGKVALITGAARGQGRSHALALAREGADIFGVDMCAQVESVAYPLSTTDDLAETTSLVTGTGRRIETFIGDVRSSADMRAATEQAISTFGKIDIVVANAGHLDARIGLGDGRPDLAGHDRHQPDRRLQHGPLRDPADDRAQVRARSS